MLGWGHEWIFFNFHSDCIKKWLDIVLVVPKSIFVSNVTIIKPKKSFLWVFVKYMVWHSKMSLPNKNSFSLIFLKGTKVFYLSCLKMRHQFILLFDNKKICKINVNIMRTSMIIVFCPNPNKKDFSEKKHNLSNKLV